MARGRMISGSIATSESFNAMSEWGRLTWCLMIPHLDDHGMIEGSATKLKAQTQPLSGRTVPEIAAAVREMIEEEILVAYEADGRIYLAAPSFDRHQVNLHKRTPKPKLPMPDQGRKLTGEQYEQAAISRKFPEFPGKCRSKKEGRNRKERNRKNSIGTEADASESHSKRSAQRLFTESDPELEAARYLFDRIRAHTPDATEPNWQAWARQFDLIFRVDSRDPKDVRAVIAWATADEFWCQQVLSPGALRGTTRNGADKFTSLLVKMREATTPLRASTGGLIQ